MPLGLDYHSRSEKERQLKVARQAAGPFHARYMELLFPVDCHSSYWWLPPRGNYWWQPRGPSPRFGQTCGHRRCACQMLGSSWRPVPWTRFLQLLGLVSFVAAPWGHGLDTHRVWEALMMGSVPVVLSSPLDVLYEQFPVIILQSWQEAQPNSTWHWRRKILRKWGRVQAKLRTRFWTDLIRERHQAALRS
ncbi:unnamed protein product [Durusdinium trenchii]|uniref:Exostosin GT47 domain-containing protein n=1 Tax=Durusdinium trenchii TaxID=1381693 RepID=A0ABP0MCB6_9DINO